ncbi:MAG: hypothetical protein COB81_02585 [Flavobacteriaceae bacterium]|nr:MAG: hypothetical protein COB81_02585 [Flavobacteriaceae bacterium]
MRKVLLLLSVFVLFSCNDGNFEVPSMEFETSISECGDLLLYRLNSSKTEAIAISLSEDSFPTEETETIISLSNSITVTYLIFDAKVGTSYFCNDIPPTTPKVLQNYTATNGNIVITTTAITDADDILTGYSHSIILTDLILDNGNEKIGFETFDFGDLERDL